MPQTKVCLKNAGETDKSGFWVPGKGAFEGKSGHIARKRPEEQVPKDAFSVRQVFFRHTLNLYAFAGSGKSIHDKKSVAHLYRGATPNKPNQLYLFSQSGWMNRRWLAVKQYSKTSS
ncbi:MAG: hypothetical protein SFV22_13860 [Saprospiraceae bacterium]|nr:hypothetical protein [Saprospiraceae bacterium]